MHNAELPNFTW